MTTLRDKLHKLFKELVPASGQASTVAGEIVRAVCRINYKYINDGDHVGVGYGKETCNPAARFLMKKAGADVAQAVSDLWGVENGEHYALLLDRLIEEVLAYIEDNPELKTTLNTEDMLGYANPHEDKDDDNTDDNTEEE